MRRGYALAIALILSACSTQTEPAEFDVFVAGGLGNPVVTDVSGTLGEQYIEIEEGSGSPVRRDGPILYSMSSFDNRGELIRGGKVNYGMLTDDIPYSSTIEGKTEGSRIIIANPQGREAEIVVIDLLYTQAFGEPVEQHEGGPKIVEGDDGGPILAEAFGSIDTMSTVLLRRGDGAQIDRDSTIIAQYSVYNSESGQLIDSSWTTGPIKTSVGELGEGLQVAIEGSRVGSRVMALLPAADGYGDYDAIVFIDLLSSTSASD